MKNLFKAFLNSLHNPVWLIKQRFASSQAWSYFSLLVFVLAVLVAVSISVLAFPIIKSGQKYFATEVPNFDAKLKDGTLSVNLLAQPYIYRDKNDEFILVVDTIRTSTAAFSDYVTSSPLASMLITADRMEFVENETGQSRIQKWSNVPDGKITKQELNIIVQNITDPWLYFIGIILVFIIFYLVFFISKLYTILVVALVSSVLAKFTDRNLQFKNIFNIGLYAITLPSIIGIIFMIFGVGISYVEFMAMLAFMIAVVMTEKPIKKIDE